MKSCQKLTQSGKSQTKVQKSKIQKIKDGKDPRQAKAKSGEEVPKRKPSLQHNCKFFDALSFSVALPYSLLTYKQNRYCQICYQESKFFEGCFDKNPRPEDPLYKFWTSMIHCRSCDQSFHAGCLDISQDQIDCGVRKAESDGKYFDVEFCQFKEGCPFCLEEKKQTTLHHTSSRVCKECLNGDHLSASVFQKPKKLSWIGKAQKQHTKNIHLVCALFNPKYQLVSLNPPLFTEKFDDQLEICDKCSICKEDVTNGIKCNKPGCKEVVHLRCALEKKAKILKKHGAELIEEGQNHGQSYNYCNQFWNISYGLFKKIGRDPNDIDNIKISEEDLETSHFYKEARQTLDRAQSDIVSSGYKDDIIFEINQETINIYGKKSVIEDICIEYRAVCPNHKEDEPSYCLCGVNEEKKSIFDDQEKMKAEGQIDAIYCNNCNTWYHQNCVNYNQPNRRNPESQANKDFYSCPKCCALEGMCNDPMKFMKVFHSDMNIRKNHSRGNSNFLHERMNHVLKRDFIQVIDYMVILKSISRGMHSLSYEDIKYWQKEMPFSIEFLLRVKFRSINMEVVIVKQFKNTVIKLLKDLIEDFCSRKNSLTQVDLRKLSNRLLERLIQLSEFRVDQSRDFEGFQVFLEDLRLVGERMGILQNVNYDPNQLKDLYSKLHGLGLLEDTHFRTLMHGAMIDCANFIHKITEKFKEFRSQVEALDIFKVNLEDLKKLPTINQIHVGPRTIEEHVLRNLVEKKGKPVVADFCRNLESLKSNFQSALESMFFSNLDDQGLENLRRYGEYISQLSAWQVRQDACRMKMKYMQSLKSQHKHHLQSENWEGQFLTLAEYELLLGIDKKYEHMIPSEQLEVIKGGIENARTIYENFSEIMEKIVFKGIPVNKENFKRIKLHILIERIRDYPAGCLSMSEQEFEHLASELSELSTQHKHQELKVIQELREKIKKASLESYPGILSKEEKFEHIQKTFEQLSLYGINGRCFNKLQELVKPIKWLDQLLEAYKISKIVHQDLSRESFVADFKPKLMERKAKEEILEKFSLLNPKKSDQLDIDRNHFKAFPELKSILNCISLEYSSKLMSKFKNEKTININLMLKLQYHREVLNTEKDEDKLFITKRGRVLEFMKKIKTLSEKKEVGLYEFSTLVEDYVAKFKLFSDYPKYPSSLFAQAFNWLRQAKLLVNLINEIKNFDSQKLTWSTYNNFKGIYDVFHDQSFKKVNIKREDLYSESVQNFLDYMKEADIVLQRQRNLVQRIDKANFSIRKAKDGDLNTALIEALSELPTVDSGKDWIQKAHVYAFVKEEFTQIKQDLEYSLKIHRHLEETFRSKLAFMDTNKPFDSRFNQNSVLQFQTFIKTTIRKICELKYISITTLDILRTIHLLHNMAKAFMDDQLTLNELQDRIVTFMELESAICSDKCVSILEETKLEMKLKSKLEEGRDLINKFMDSKNKDLDEFFEEFDLVQQYKLDLFDRKTKTRREQLEIESYFFNMGKMKECWITRESTTRISIPDTVTLEELQLIKSYVCPQSLYDWAVKQYSKDRLLQTWAVHIARKEKCNGYEVDILNQKFLLGEQITSDLSNKIKQKLQESIDTYAAYKVQVKQSSEKIESFNINSIMNSLDSDPKLTCQFLDKELEFLCDILFTFYKLLSPALFGGISKLHSGQKLSLLYISKFCEVFEQLESRKGLEGPEIDVFTLNKAVKSEVKEEIYVKNEARIRKGAFSEILNLVKSVALQVYDYQYQLRQIIFYVTDKTEKLERCELKDVEKVFFEELRSQMPDSCDKFIYHFDLDLIPEQIYNKWMVEHGMAKETIFGENMEDEIDQDSIIFLEGGSAFIDFERKNAVIHKSLKISEVINEVRKYLKEEVTNQKGWIEAEANRRLKNANMEKTFADIKKAQQKSSKGSKSIGLIPKRQEIQRSYLASKKSKLQHEQHVNLHEQIDTKFREVFSCIAREDRSKIVEKILSEISTDNSSSKLKKFGDCMSKLLKSGLAEIHQKKIAAQITEKMDKGDLRNYSIVDQIALLDTRITETMLGKRNRFSESSTNFASHSKLPNRCGYKINLEFLQISVDNGAIKKPLKLEFFTLQESSQLNKILIPEDLQEIELSSESQIPDWVEFNKKDESQTEMLYGFVIDKENTLFGLEAHQSEHHYFSYEGDLGQCSFVISLVKHLPQRISEMYCLEHPAFRDSFFFALDLKELPEKKAKLAKKQIARDQLLATVRTPASSIKEKKLLQTSIIRREDQASSNFTPEFNRSGVLNNSTAKFGRRQEPTGGTCCQMQRSFKRDFQICLGSLSSNVVIKLAYSSL